MSPTRNTIIYHTLLLPILRTLESNIITHIAYCSLPILTSISAPNAHSLGIGRPSSKPSDTRGERLNNNFDDVDTNQDHDQLILLCPSPLIDP